MYFVIQDRRMNHAALTPFESIVFTVAVATPFTIPYLPVGRFSVFPCPDLTKRVERERKNQGMLDRWQANVDGLIHWFGGMTQRDIVPYLPDSVDSNERQIVLDVNLRLANDPRFREIVRAFPEETEYPYDDNGSSGSPFRNRTAKATVDLHEYLEKKGLSGTYYQPAYQAIRDSRP